MIKMYRVKKFNWVFILCGIMAAFGGCKQDKELDVATRGKISISVDENFKMIFDTEIIGFQSMYENATIEATYKSEAECFQDLFDGDAELIVASRPLTVDELDRFERKTIFPQQVKVATDAVALIVHPDNIDSVFSIYDLKQILRGEITKWSQLNPESNLEEADDEIQLVFDDAESGTHRYVEDSILYKSALRSRIHAAGSNPGVMEYVKTHKGAIGVIGVNWISDRDDRKVQSFLKGIRVAMIEAPDTSLKAGEAVQPYQAFIKARFYPFVRGVYMIEAGGRTGGLGTGFATWVAGVQGQRILLKSGLVPEFTPARYVSFPEVEGAKNAYKIDVDKILKENRIIK